MNHCCPQMTQFIEDLAVPIHYSPKFRGYSLKLFPPSNAIQLIFYCPWCGKKLPKRLKDDYVKTLKKEYKIKDPLDPDTEDTLPEEFKSDAWWKKRNL